MFRTEQLIWLIPLGLLALFLVGVALVNVAQLVRSLVAGIRTAFSTRLGWALLVVTVLTILVLSIALPEPENLLSDIYEGALALVEAIPVPEIGDENLEAQLMGLIESPTPTPVVLSACAVETSVWLRDGPGLDFNRVDGLALGGCLELDARDGEGAWGREADSGLWLLLELVELSGPAEGLPVARGFEK